MKRLKIQLAYLALFSALLTSSCQEKRTEEHNTRWDGEKTYQLGDDKPFTGVVEEKDSDGQIKRETTVKNGEDISVTEYYKDGSVKYQKEGNGDKQYYSPDGRKITYEQYREIQRRNKKP